MHWYKPIFILFIFFFSWLFLRIFLFDTFIIASSSMLPTLRKNDLVLVEKVSYGARLYTKFHFSSNDYSLKSFRLKGLKGIRRGDVFVFNGSLEKNRIKFDINTVYCKRCFACPGDTIVNSNGVLLNETYQFMEDDPFPSIELDDMFEGGVCHYPAFFENKKICVPKSGEFVILDKTNYLIYKKVIEFETGLHLSYNSKKNKIYLGNKHISQYEFLNDYYFTLGDNYYHSLDSRYWGFVPESFIIGKTKTILFPLSEEKNQRIWKRIFYDIE